MALKQSYIALIRKLDASKKPGSPQLFGDGVLGDFQATILATIARLSQAASVTELLEYIVETANEAADVAQTYAAIKILASNGHIELQAAAKPETGRKSSARYAITNQGRAALKAKLARMRLLTAYIEPAVQVAQKPQSTKTGTGTGPKKQ